MLLDKQLLFLPFFYVLSFIYFSTVAFSPLISQISQVLVIAIAISIFFCYRKIEYSRLFAFFAIFFYSITNGVYFLQALSIVTAYYSAKNFNIYYQARLLYFFTSIAVFLSMLYFYSGSDWLFSAFHYPNYLIEGFDRLLGLDASPAMLGFLSGLSITFLLFDVNLSLKFRWSLCLLFLITLILTASRTGIIGLIISLIVAHFKRLNFSIIVMFLILFPLVATITYSNSENDLSIRMLLETLTSSRVIIWSNIYLNFQNFGLIHNLIGIGKPLDIGDIYFLMSHSTNFIYSPQASLESSWLKLLIYHGYSFYICFGMLVSFGAYKIINYRQRVIFGYLVFAAIFYDFLFSLQYYFLTLIFMTVLMRNYFVSKVVSRNNC